MEKEKLESLLIDYIDGGLTAAARAGVEQLLSTDKAAMQLYKELKEVTLAMQEAPSLDREAGHERIFEANVKKELAAWYPSRVFLRPVFYRVAAAIALVIAGLAGGYWLHKGNQNARELAALRKEVEETKQTMMAMLSDGQSASRRMQGVNVAFTLSAPDDDVVNALGKAMMSDPNTNVRLAALDALGQFAHEPSIRKMLVRSLSSQDDPMVQIALIQLLVGLKEKAVITDLEKIIKSDDAMDAVKDEAYTGILKLS
ncbi:MAG TPA: HEAT repeat domain-containing protein [Cyclobacteriaceae bacterium]|nr:HEAT repeat domain-containing protein [Cyclobacteriaceae bacterium]HPI80061.1 HEAT repeat domain-containing protein [Cyclobacteriaceae bacterium]